MQYQPKVWIFKEALVKLFNQRILMYNIFFYIFISLFSFFSFVVYCFATETAEQHTWIELNSDLNLTNFTIKQDINNTIEHIEIIILKINPELYDIDLYMASELNIESLSLEAWAKKYNLLAVTNASMYLPDFKTSTGYMRKESYINNPRIATNFGAFLVSNPINKNLAKTTILDKYSDNWEELLPQYKTVVQNYRLINDFGKILWNQDNKASSVAAIGLNKEGNILFLHCPNLISTYNFTEIVLKLPINLIRLMYVEGGSEAALHIQTSKVIQTWTGKFSNLWNQNLSPSYPIPNIIAVKPKKQ